MAHKDISISWSKLRQILKERNINEQKFRNWLIKKDARASPIEILELIINHVYHSTEEHLFAPPHLRTIYQNNHSRQK